MYSRRAFPLVTALSIVFACAPALVAVGCGSGSSGNGGSGGSGGSASQGAGGRLGGTGGRIVGAGGMVVDAGPILPTCTPVAASTALILDFSSVTDPSQATFGTYGTNFAGGTYQYPGAIVSSFTGMSWHVTGTVGDYSGFGLYLACKSDVSAFTGIQFDISGTFGDGDGGASPAHVNMGIGTPADEFDSAHASMPPTWGACTTGCVPPTINVPISATTATFSAPWSSFTGGMPISQPDPRAILYIFFTLPWSGVTQAPYSIDIMIDNVMFMIGTPGDAGPSDTAPDAPMDTAAGTDVATDMTVTPTDADSQ